MLFGFYLFMLKMGGIVRQTCNAKACNSLLKMLPGDIVFGVWAIDKYLINEMDYEGRIAIADGYIVYRVPFQIAHLLILHLGIISKEQQIELQECRPSKSLVVSFFVVPKQQQ